MKARRPSMQKSPEQSHSGPGVVRIISGQWKGRKLPVLDVQGLRPTTDRVKETLFNWLMQDIHGKKVLDCFSGSGSLALEALSRHAESALLLEMDAKAARQLSQHLQTLQCQNAQVLQVDTLAHLAKPATTHFDLVFIDPPFRQGLVDKCCHLLEKGWLTADALIYLECEKELPISNLPSNWRIIKEKIAGQLAYRLLQRQS